MMPEQIHNYNLYPYVHTECHPHEIMYQHQAAGAEAARTCKELFDQLEKDWTHATYQVATQFLKPLRTTTTIV